MTSDARNPERRTLAVLNEDPRAWEVKVWVTLARLYTRLERRLGQGLATHGLSMSQFDVLATLWHGEGITQQELAERLLVTKGNVVGLIDRVSAAGWVERRPDPEDRRANRLYLTDAARTLLSEVFPCHAADVCNVFGRLTEDELRQMLQMLEKLEGGLDGV
jgi:MarR family transcriptional regulator, organic hydroperoxide resistance regulator